MSTPESALTDELRVLDALLALDVASEQVERYGMHPDQFIEWYGPEDGKVVTFIHGGYFHQDGSLSYLRPAALALGEAGYRVALPEYRRIAENFALTIADMRTLAMHPQLADSVWVGHSAGSIFVLNVLFNMDLSPAHAVVLAPIFDMARDVTEFVEPSSSKLAQWVGGMPTEMPATYAAYDPMSLYRQLGTDVFVNLNYQLDIIHGELDKTIPIQRTRDLVSEPFNIAIVPNANHQDVISPAHDAWILLLGALG